MAAIHSTIHRTFAGIQQPFAGMARSYKCLQADRHDCLQRQRGVWTTGDFLQTACSAGVAFTTLVLLFLSNGEFQKQQLCSVIRT